MFCVHFNHLSWVSCWDRWVLQYFKVSECLSKCSVKHSLVSPHRWLSFAFYTTEEYILGILFGIKIGIIENPWFTKCLRLDVPYDWPTGGSKLLCLFYSPSAIHLKFDWVIVYSWNFVSLAIYTVSVCVKILAVMSCASHIIYVFSIKVCLPITPFFIFLKKNTICLPLYYAARQEFCG